MASFRALVYKPTELHKLMVENHEFSSDSPQPFSSSQSETLQYDVCNFWILTKTDRGHLRLTMHHS